MFRSVRFRGAPSVVSSRFGLRSMRRSLGSLTIAAVVLIAGGLVLGGGSGQALTQASVSWGVGAAPVLPANAVTAGNQFVTLSSVSCASAGDCSAVGSY